jgi:hypothetical protein
MSTYRHDNGRFAFGNRGGPGRPRRTVEAQYLTALREAVPIETWTKVCETAVAQAVAGDAKAREWLGSYLIGKPWQAVEVSGFGGTPISLGVIAMILREVAPEPERQARIATLLRQLQGPGDGTGSDGGDGGDAGGPVEVDVASRLRARRLAAKGDELTRQAHATAVCPPVKHEPHNRVPGHTSTRVRPKIC